MNVVHHSLYEQHTLVAHRPTSCGNIWKLLVCAGEGTSVSLVSSQGPQRLMQLGSYRGYQCLVLQLCRIHTYTQECTMNMCSCYKMFWCFWSRLYIVCIQQTITWLQWWYSGFSHANISEFTRECTQAFACGMQCASGMRNLETTVSTYSMQTCPLLSYHSPAQYLPLPDRPGNLHWTSHRQSLRTAQAVYKCFANQNGVHVYCATIMTSSWKGSITHVHCTSVVVKRVYYIHTEATLKTFVNETAFHPLH